MKFRSRPVGRFTTQASNIDFRSRSQRHVQDVITRIVVKRQNTPASSRRDYEPENAEDSSEYDFLIDRCFHNCHR